jgi:lipopolysaccharide/colanic/teichoic acid biosynthesis glycosyltransferase
MDIPTYTLHSAVGLDFARVGGWQRAIKRTLDVLAVTLGLIFAAPLMALIAILIRLDSSGPALFKQERIGEGGRPFTMYKFRTMRVDADPALHRAHVTRLIQQNLSLEQCGSASLKLARDPRITRAGCVLRKTSLDELPQIINVLRGEMSLVGPRPPLRYEVELYKDWHRRRLQAVPGITGLWQVEGRNLVSFDDMVRIDLRYIERQSLWLDLKILLQTPLAMVGGHGAG